MVSQFMDDDESTGRESVPLLEATLVLESQAFDRQSSAVLVAESVPAESSRVSYWALKEIV